MKPIHKLLMGIMLGITFILSVHAQVPTDNVVAYFPFNGSENDVSGNGAGASASGVTIASDRLGKENAAYSFNGTGSLIYLSGNFLPGSSAFCISFWFKLNGYRPVNDGFYGQQLIDFRGEYQISVGYLQPDHPTYPGSIVFSTYNPSTGGVNCLTPNNFINLHTWYHVVANFGSNNMELYINGSLVSSQYQTAPSAVSGYHNTIGKDYNMDKDRLWLNGLFDELIVYKRKLSSDEVQAIYTRQQTASEILELYVPVGFNYDAAGNRQSRNVISLKKAKFINVHDSIIEGNLAQKSESLLEMDSLKYTDLDQKVKIFPNPTKGQLQTELTGFDFTQKSGIYVYGSSGTLIIQKVPANPSDVIDLSSYPAGIYIMRIVIGDKVSEWKILKE